VCKISPGGIFEISKNQDGGGSNLEKSKNSHISAMISVILTKFGEFGTVTHFDPLGSSDR